VGSQVAVPGIKIGETSGLLHCRYGHNLWKSQLPGVAVEKDRPEITIIAEPMSEEAVTDHTKQTLANEDVVLKSLRDHPGKSGADCGRCDPF
jgi:hypothetical protein